MKKTDERRLTDFPDYNAALQKLRGLEAEHGQLQQRVRDEEHRRLAPRAMTSRTAAAIALLEGATATAVGMTDAELTEAAGRLDVLAAAIPIQRQKVELATNTASRVILQNVLPEHLAAAGKIRVALMSLQAALKEEQAIRDQLESSGVSFNAPLQSVAFHPRRAGSAIEMCALWLAELKVYQA